MGEVVEFKRPEREQEAIKHEVRPESAAKKAVLEAALRGGVAKVVIDARKGAVVPTPFSENYHLILDLSWEFEPRDMVLTDECIEATLSFCRSPFKVKIPWSAVYRIGTVLWMSEVPAEIGISINRREDADEEPTTH